MLKKLILVAVAVVAALSLFLMYKERHAAKTAVKDESVFEIPVTTTQVTPGLEVR